MRVTLRELAKYCGCSVPSASRALKNDPNISSELKRKVRGAAKELGYIPNAIAESMRTGQTNTIAIILQDLLNPFFSIIANKMERNAANHGLNSIIITTGYSSERELNAVYTALGKKVDGVMLLPVQQDIRGIDALQKAGTPFILVGRNFNDVFQDCVMPDDRRGAYLVTRHLLEKGHRRILFINSFEYISSSRYREQGFRQAMAEAGAEVRQEDVRHISTEQGECGKIVGERFAGKSEYTALYCYCDALAFEAYYHLRALGRAVPGDVALAGVDDLQSYVTYPIRLTSAGYDIEAMACQAVELLLQKIAHHRHKDKNRPPWQNRVIIMNQYLSPGDTT